MKINNQATNSIIPPNFAQKNLEASQLFLKIVFYSVVLWLCLFVGTLFLFCQQETQVNNKLNVDTKIQVK